MSLNQLETQALGAIADGLAGSDPRLASMLTIFSRLAAGEEMPAREKTRGGFLSLGERAPSGVVTRLAEDLGDEHAVRIRSGTILIHPVRIEQGYVQINLSSRNSLSPDAWLSAARRSVNGLFICTYDHDQRQRSLCGSDCHGA